MKCESNFYIMITIFAKRDIVSTLNKYWSLSRAFSSVILMHFLMCIFVGIVSVAHVGKI